MSSTRSRTLALLAAGALLFAALTACGEDQTTATSAEPASSSVDTSAFVDSLISAVKEQESARAELTFGTAVKATATFRYGDAEPAARIAADLFGQKIEVVVVDGAFYLKRSATAKFVKLDKGDPSLSLFGGFSDVDPQQSITGIADGIKEVREIGTETIDGTELTQYAVTVDGEAIGSDMLAMIPGVDVGEEIVVDLFLDAENLVHRAEADLGQNKLVLVVSDWGKPVTITAPTASEVLANQ